MALNLDANLLGGLKTIKRLPLLHLLHCFPSHDLFFLSLFFFSGDHLFYLNSGPLTFSPVGSCLKKNHNFSTSCTFLLYLHILCPRITSLDRGYHAKQNRTFFSPFLQFRTCSFAQGITEYHSAFF